MSTGQLIDEVHKYPAIFDPSNEDYRNKRIKENCWKEISKVCQIPADNAQKRWKILRDQHRRYMKKLPSGSAASSTKGVWEWKSALSWLDNFTKCRPTDSNLTQMSESSADEESVKNYTVTASPTGDTSTGKISEVQSSTQAQSTSSSKRPRKCASAINEAIMKLCDMQEEDEEELFGRQIAASLRKLSKSAKSNAKYKIQGVIYEAEQSDLCFSSSSLLSYLNE